ncbi:HU family DNA-binding protein [Candidatus Parcubacteria bacterium]|nr:HU family DNA-binding protein [Candidatus Parcubacteria bacterium]
MTKDELIQSMVKKTGLSKRLAGETLAVVLDEITKSLSKGKEVAFTGFGKFEVVKRKARQGINPKTGEKIKISARKVPKFKAGKMLKDAVK